MTRRKPKDYLIECPDDGLLTADVGPWAADKYRRVGMYAEIFSTGMKARWDARVYLDLFSGPGVSRVRTTGRLVMGSPLIALSLPTRFDRYIFADRNHEALNALRKRVEKHASGVNARFIAGDANAKIEEIILQIPGPEAGSVLSFCLLDPYGLHIHFDTVRQLASGRPVDFLILLALHVDANRNLDRYVTEESEVIDRFLGDTTWRPRWNAARARREPPVKFLATEYAERMAGLGYLPMPLDQMVKIRTHEKRLPLYYLAFFSKHPRGVDLWQKVLRQSDDQFELLQ